MKPQYLITLLIFTSTSLFATEQTNFAKTKKCFKGTSIGHPKDLQNGAFYFQEASAILKKYNLTQEGAFTYDTQALNTDSERLEKILEDMCKLIKKIKPLNQKNARVVERAALMIDNCLDILWEKSHENICTCKVHHDNDNSCCTVDDLD